MALEDQLLEEFSHLNPHQCKLVLDFVHSLRLKQAESPKIVEAQPGPSAYDLAQSLGLIGAFEGPSDLSHNKAYFDDFGK